MKFHFEEEEGEKSPKCPKSGGGKSNSSGVKLFSDSPDFLSAAASADLLLGDGERRRKKPDLLAHRKEKRRKKKSKKDEKVNEKTIEYAFGAVILNEATSQ